MLPSDPKYSAYISVMRDHLKPAMGCTEPICVAYAAAVAARALGARAEKVRVSASGNMIKNARVVTVPNTGGRKGIDAACAAGIVAGRPERELQVISEVTDAQRDAIGEMLAAGIIEVVYRPDARLLDVLVEMEGEGHTAEARIVDRHTNVVLVRRDGETVVSQSIPEENMEVPANEKMLSIQDIFDFADSCRIEDIRPILEPQVRNNGAISQEGITGKWGNAIGRILLDTYGDQDVRIRAKAFAAAGSDARMSGCEMPVIINSGSGNQGITVSIPVMEYARSMDIPEERMYRALALSNLAAIHLKAQIGCLSAYCGAVSAGSAAGAGIAYLCGGGLYEVNHTIVNTLAILSGTICDGAKSSCAAKIAESVDAAIIGYQMTKAGKQFRDGEGIIKKGVENTIANIGRLGRDGMRQTEEEILQMMMS